MAGFIQQTALKNRFGMYPATGPGTRGAKATVLVRFIITPAGRKS
jgi:hypothetical protein